MADLIVQRARGRRHVLAAWPLGSEAYDQDEFVEVRTSVTEGKLMCATPGGCLLGCTDRASGLPHKKSMRFLMSSEVLADYLDSADSCDGGQEHQQLGGSKKYGSRTRQAAEWPGQFDTIVKGARLQKLDVGDSRGAMCYRVDEDVDEDTGIPWSVAPCKRRGQPGGPLSVEFLKTDDASLRSCTGSSTTPRSAACRGC